MANEAAHFDTAAHASLIHIAKSVESINLLLQQVKKAGGVCAIHLSVVELK